MKLLVVEDEPVLGPLIQHGLAEAGYLVDLVNDGLAAQELALLGEYDALVLDLSLPHLDGLELCRELRNREIGTPVLMLTARGTLDDKLAGFRCGADDYLTKPFDFPELVARVQSLVRRAHRGRQRVLRLADLEVDTQQRRVRRGGEIISLTPKEYALLEYMLYRTGQPLSRTQILDHVWASDYCGGSNVVDVFIRYLRRKLDEGREPRLVQTISGVGYCLRVEP